MHKLSVRLHLALPLVGAVLISGCVDEFNGSNIQLDFGPTVPAQVLQGVTPPPGPFLLPANTHYSLYGVKETRDASGAVVSAEYTEIQRFEIHQIVEYQSPCYIDPVGSRFPGLHATQFEARMRAQTGIADLANPPAGATEEDLIDVATALQRSMNISEVSGLGRPPRVIPRPNLPPRLDPGGLKAITSASTALYPGVATACVEDDATVDRTLIPPPQCIQDESNKLRLELCSAVWKSNPTLYAGTDRVLTEPLAGEYFGIVTGLNPINGAVLGGSQFVVKNMYADYSLYTVNWQFDDANGDGVPDYPPGATPSEYGTPVATGRPSTPTRGVTRVVMAGIALAENTIQMSIFSDIGDDDVHF